ncbi:glyoxalase/bleomycin resistance protein/dioxygenase [Niallia circulans]|jgi:glyoxylase I family protein|uniref:SMU1112c/YaeR family gloxylase I-like metalloprotein n=1 Tax=Niallia circulans TaxID=1397 RepID=UPI00077C5D2F|nr:VOC family protein [Niallia circulans]MCM2981920.1 VOC family protein [Niallia circulans]MDR4316349.1 VOC family protein [Niallia circulans]MED3838480.1 VOC family protein [Niallia circulans]MED4243953.1 VOC family protein [Niallia circulans]MED4246347.1 VOC family protein [Niallia circulans]
MFNVNKIHHIAIICSNYEVSKHFYVELLGFKPINEVYREERDSYKLDLLVNNIYQIELFSFPKPRERPSYPEAAGLRHIAFEVNNIEETVQYLQSNNITVEDIRIDPFTNKKFTFFADPDGLPIEVYEA